MNQNKTWKKDFNNLDIYIEIPDMPVLDQKSIDVFNNNLINELQDLGIKINSKYNHSKDFFVINANILDIDAKQKIKGPKKNTFNEAFFRDKYAGNNFFYENEYLYVEVENDNISEIIINAFINTLKKHAWSIKAKWNESKEVCCRPIKNIGIFVDNKALDGSFADVKFMNKKPEKPISNFNDKLLDLEKEIVNFPYDLNQEFLFNFLVYMFDYPKILPISFDQKFSKIPAKIIEYFLQKEQLAILLYKEGKMLNKCLCLVEKNCNITAENFTKSVEAKLLDLLLQYNRDISKSIELYKQERDDKLINDKIGTIKDKILRMKNLSIKIFKDNTNILNSLDFFAIDTTSEIVSENPSLLGCIAQEVLPNYNQNSYEIKIIDCIDNLIELSSINCLPTGSKDQFGLKKQCDFVINYLLNNELDVDLHGAEGFFKQRLKIALDKINPLLNIIKIERKIICKYLKWNISIENLNRIINLSNKSECDQHIVLHSIENNLINKIEKLNIENINDILEQVIQYIDGTNISPYIERKELLDKFLDSVKKVIQI